MIIDVMFLLDIALSFMKGFAKDGEVGRVLISQWQP